MCLVLIAAVLGLVAAGGLQDAYAQQIQFPVEVTPTGMLTDGSSREFEGARNVDTFTIGTNTYAAVASYFSDALQIVNVTDPASPTPVGNLREGGTRALDGAFDVAIFTIGTNTYAAVVALEEDALQIVDVTNPARPTAVGNLKDADEGNTLLLDGARSVDTFTIGTNTYAAVVSSVDDGLQIIDVTNPASPAAAGRLGNTGSLLFDAPYSVDVFTIGTNTYAVVTSFSDAGIQLVNVSDPTDPQAAGNLRHDGTNVLLTNAQDVTVFTMDSTTYAVVVSENGDSLQIVDVSNPARPTAVGNLKDADGGNELLLDGAYGVDIFTLDSRTYAAIASNIDHGLQIIDITDPATPTAAGHLGDGGSRELRGARGVNVFTIDDKTYAAVAAWGDSGFQLAEISQIPISPDNPIFYGSLPDSTQLLLDRSRGVDTFEIGGSTYAVVASGGEDGIQIVDVTNPASLTAVGSLADNTTRELDGARAVDVFATGGKTYAVVASVGDDGVEIVDVTNPASPASVGEVEDDGNLLLGGANAVTTFRIGPNIYVAVTTQNDDGLQIIDITNPASPAAAGKLEDDSNRLLVDTSAVDIFETGGSTYAVVASWGEPGLQIIDITNPASPAAAGQLEDDSDLLLNGIRALAVFEEGGSTYVAAASFHDDGLQIVDVTDPQNPAAAGKLADGGELQLDGASGVEIFRADKAVYAIMTSQSDDGLQIVDVTDPDKPAAAGFLEDDSQHSLRNARDLALSTIDGDTYAVVVTNVEGLQMVNLGETDTIMPEFASATLDENTGLMTITFSETIDVSDTDLSKVYVSDAGETNEVALTGATFDDTVPDSDTISFMLTPSQLDDANQMNAPQLDIAAGAVSDLLGNRISAAADNPITTASPDSPLYSGSLPDSAQLLLDRSRGVDTFEIGGSTYAVVASGGEDGIQIVDVTNPASLTAVGSLADNTTRELDGARAVDVFATGGKTYAVVASVGDDGVEIVDVTNPASPASVGEVEDDGNLLLDGANAVTTFRIGPNIYVAVTTQNDDGLQIIDITNPASPAAAGKLEDDSDRLLVDTSAVDIFETGGSTYAVVASWGEPGLQIIDITNPASPAAAGQLEDDSDLLLNGTRALAVFEEGGSTYVAAASFHDDGLQIVDVTDPQNPAAAGKLADGGELQLDGASGVEIFRVDGTAYAAMTSQSDGGLQIVDLTDPDSPTAAGSLEDGPQYSLRNARDLALFTSSGDTYAAVVTEAEGLQVAKLGETDTIMPEFASATLDVRTGLMAVTFSEAIDVSDTDLSKVYVSDTGETNEVALTGATFDDTVPDSDTISLTLTQSQIDDVGQMRTPQLDIAAGAISDLLGNRISAAADNPITTASPDSPLYSGSLPDSAQLLLDRSRGVDTFEIGGSTYAVVASGGEDGIQIVDVTNPASLTAVGSLADNTTRELDGARAVDVFATGGKTYAVVASNDDDGVEIVDVTNPASPASVGEVEDGGNLLLDGVNAVTTFRIGPNIYAAVTTQNDDGLQIIDITNPASPAAAGKLEDDSNRLLVDTSAVDIFETGGSTYAVVASWGEPGLQIIDITNPASPAAAGQLEDDSDLLLNGTRALAVFEEGGSTYVAAASFHDDGLQIVDVTDPQNPAAAGKLADGGELQLDGASGVEIFRVGQAVYAAMTSQSDDGLQIVDVTDPDNPSEAGSLEDGPQYSLENARDLDLFMIGRDTYAAVVSDTEGLQMAKLVEGADLIPNNAPVAPDATATTTEDVQVTITPAISDPDTIDVPRISAVENPPNGTATHDGTTITYTPDQDYTGTDTFGYTVSDGIDTAQGTITITITRDNNDPVLETIGSRTTVVGVQLTVTPMVTDADPTDTHTYSISRGTLPAAAVFSTSDGILTWTPTSVDGLTHEVTITVDDGRGGTDSQTFEITVSAEAIIMLNGSNPLYHELGTPYTDPGATVTDGSPVVTDASAVDANLTGDYIVNYTATSTDGNPLTASRTVVVRDTTPPVITISGEDPVTIPLGSTYTDAGASSTDNDPAYTESISTDATTVDTDRLGTYAVIYTATDAAGNTATATRTVVIPVEMIAIGAMIPQTGGLGGQLGAHHTFAAEQAIADLNAHLASTDAVWRAVLEIRDTEAAGADAAIRSLDTANVTLVSGPVRSSELDAVRNYADSNDMILFSCCSTAPSLAIAGDNVFRMAPDDSQQGPVIADLLREEYEKDVVVVVWRGDIWGEGIKNSAVAGFEALGGTVDETVGSYDPDDANLNGTFAGLAQRLNTAVSGHTEDVGADRVSVLFIGQDETFRFVDRAADYPALGTVRWMGSDASVLDGNLAGDPRIRGFLAGAEFQASAFAEDSGSDLYESLTDRIDDEFGTTTPAVYTYSTYDTIRVLGLALERAGWDAGFAEIKDAIPQAASGHEGAIGDINLNAAGDLDRSIYAVWGIDGSGWTRLGVWDDGFIPDSRGGGNDDEWQTAPTFGISPQTGSQVVACGYSMDGTCRDVLDYHVDYRRESIQTNTKHDFTLRAHSVAGVQQFQIGFGVPEVGSPMGASEAVLTVELGRDYSADSTYEILDAAYTDPNDVIGEAVLGVELVGCMSPADPTKCVELSIGGLLFREQMYHEPFVIYVMDVQRWSAQNYMNDGLLVQGDSMNPAPLDTAGIYKRGQQHEAAVIQLERTDKLADLWADQWGNEWARNSHGTWYRTVPDAFERHQDDAWKVMNRMNSNFATLVQAEHDRAVLVFDAAQLVPEPGSVFAYEYPDIQPGDVRLEQLADALQAERLRAQEIIDRMMSMTYHVSD